MNPVKVIGAGLAGSEAALFLARHGVPVTLYEMRPAVMTPAHRTGALAELVCSNSLRSDDPEVAAGLLKEEMRKLGSAVLACADRSRVPAGTALAVDRDLFSSLVSEEVEKNPGIALLRSEVTSLPCEGLAILAPGPLVSPGLAAQVEALVGGDRLFFFDAIAPIADAESLDHTKLFRASRYEEGEGDYLNVPLDRDTYFRFVEALLSGEKMVPHGFDAEERLPLFSGCQPIEAIAASGPLSLAHGPMRPTGFRGAPLGKSLFAVLQLRAENSQRTAYNLVGFQTRLKQSEQKRIFRMLPGLERAEFLRFGSLHRNSYIDSPRLLRADLSFSLSPDLFAAGQFAGAEGYIESTAIGLLAALFVLARVQDRAPPIPPPETALGSILRHVTSSLESPLQPSNIHWGLFPSIPAKGKAARRAALVARARKAFECWAPLPG